MWAVPDDKKLKAGAGLKLEANSDVKTTIETASPGKQLRLFTKTALPNYEKRSLERVSTTDPEQTMHTF
jgi:hypothetical protein